eukprot:jgi/Galph1/5284/GphlegSOOS_G3917.1
MMEYTPYDGQKAYEFQSCSPQDVDKAFQAAHAAQASWKNTPLWKRAQYLKKASHILRRHEEEIAQALMKEVAKNRKDARSEVLRTADLIDYVAEEGIRQQGKIFYSDSFPSQKRNQLCLAHRVPLGVVLCIPPFNYPINLCASKVAAAVMMGNSVVIKVPSHGAISCLYLAAAFHLAKIPDGVINVISGKGSVIGDSLVTHPLVSGIALTGGSSTGISVARKSGMIPIQMELGGKDAAIVLNDAVLETAVKHIVAGAFSYNGQRCTAVKIVLVMEQVADNLVSMIQERVNKLTVGYPQENSDITAVIDSSSADYIEKLFKDAMKKGAKQVTHFKRQHNLLWPTVLDHVQLDMAVAWEEPFGPLLPIVRMKTTQEAIDIVNKNRMGLQTSIFTTNIEKAIQLADQLQTGTVHFNGQPARGPDHFPFQGWKDSGIGSQGIAYSLEAMTKVKSVVLHLSEESYASN